MSHEQFTQEMKRLKNARDMARMGADTIGGIRQADVQYQAALARLMAIYGK